MASLWKHPECANWIARFRGAAGKTVNRSTGSPEKKEAQRVAQTWEVEAAREREKPKMEMSTGGLADALAKAERLARQDRLDPARARELINDLLTAAGRTSVDAVTSRAWCNDWKASKAGAVKERSTWKYAQVTRDWLAFLQAVAEKPLENVTKAEVIAFRDKLRQSGLAARTVNQTTKLLRGIYQAAVEQGHLGRNPFAGVPPLRHDENQAKREPFTIAEVGALLETADEEWRGLILLAATSGLRLMDATRVLWKALDPMPGFMRVRTAKTGKVVEVPVHPELARWLATQPRGIGNAPLFPTLSTKGGPGKSGLSMSFKRLMERAKVSAGVAPHAKNEGRGRTTSRKSFHSLRHFSATQLAINHIRPEIARQITGHVDGATHANYITADHDALRAAVDGIRLRA